MRGEFGSDSASVNSCSDNISSQNNDCNCANAQINEISIDSFIEEDELRDGFTYKISEKLSHAQVDSYYKPIKSFAKSTNSLFTKSKLQLDSLGNGSEKNEELKLNLGDSSQFILDESQKFYRKKDEKETSQVKQESTQMKPVRFNTCNLINSSMDRLQKEDYKATKHIKISCQKIIFEYENSDSEEKEGSSTSLPSFDANYSSRK